jgi:hypothetical protein
MWRPPRAPPRRRAYRGRFVWTPVIPRHATQWRDHQVGPIAIRSNFLSLPPERVTRRERDTKTFDVVVVNNVAHHFTHAQNVGLAKRVARALTPSGVYSVGEFLRSDTPGAGGSVAATMDLYFAITSASLPHGNAKLASDPKRTLAKRSAAPSQQVQECRPRLHSAETAKRSASLSAPMDLDGDGMGTQTAPKPTHHTSRMLPETNHLR